LVRTRLLFGVQIKPSTCSEQGLMAERNSFCIITVALECRDSFGKQSRRFRFSAVHHFVIWTRDRLKKVAGQTFASRSSPDPSQVRQSCCQARARPDLSANGVNSLPVAWPWLFRNHRLKIAPFQRDQKRDLKGAVVSIWARSGLSGHFFVPLKLFESINVRSGVGLCKDSLLPPCPALRPDASACLQQVTTLWGRQISISTRLAKRPGCRENIKFFVRSFSLDAPAVGYGALPIPENHSTHKAVAVWCGICKGISSPSATALPSWQQCALGCGEFSNARTRATICNRLFFAPARVEQAAHNGFVWQWPGADPCVMVVKSLSQRCRKPRAERINIGRCPQVRSG